MTKTTPKPPRLACFAFLAPVTVCAIGCAVAGPVTLSYQAQSPVAPVPGAEKVRVKVIVRDMRQQKAWVCAKSGQRMENARQAVGTMSSRTPPAGLVSRALKAELTHRGFDIDYRGVEVFGSLVTFLCYPDGPFKIGAAVEFDLSVSRAGHRPFEPELYHRLIVGEHTPKEILTWTNDNATIALEGALADAIKQVFIDPHFVKTLLDSAPSSGP